MCSAWTTWLLLTLPAKTIAVLWWLRATTMVQEGGADVREREEEMRTHNYFWCQGLI